MPHTHTWHRTQYLLLSLPRQGLAERVVSWQCTTCPLTETLDGEIALGLPLHTPEAIEAAAETLVTTTAPAARALVRAQRTGGR